MEIREASKSQSVVHGSSDPIQHQNVIADQDEKTLVLKSLWLQINHLISAFIHLSWSIVFFCFGSKMEIPTQSMAETSVPAPTLVETQAAILP